MSMNINGLGNTYNSINTNSKQYKALKEKGWLSGVIENESMMSPEEKMIYEVFGGRDTIIKNLMKQFGVSVDETVLERVIRHGTADISDRYLTAIRDTAAEYAEGIFRRLREHEYDPELMRLYVVGGGSCILKNFGSYDKDRVIINDDICATAKGYELLAEQKRGRKGGIV